MRRNPGERRAAQVDRAVNGPDPIVLDTHGVIAGQTRDLLRGLVAEHRETNRLLRKLAGEPDQL